MEPEIQIRPFNSSTKTSPSIFAPVKWGEYYSPNIFLQSVEKDYTGYPIKVGKMPVVCLSGGQDESAGSNKAGMGVIWPKLKTLILTSLFVERIASECT